MLDPDYTVDNNDFFTWAKETFQSEPTDTPRKLIVGSQERKDEFVALGFPEENIDVMTEDIADQLTEVFPRFIIESLM